MEKETEIKSGAHKRDDSTPSSKRHDAISPEHHAHHTHPFLVAFFVIAIGLIIAMQLGLLSPTHPSQTVQPLQTMGSSPAPRAQKMRMSLSPFDKVMAKSFMDKNNDGMCDQCGMPVDMCISGGQMQCTMGSSNGIGDLGTQHIHADWKLFINGRPFDWSKFEEMHERQMHGDKTITMTSSFIHLHPQEGQTPGAVLHMHAKGVPLWLFFASMNMNLSGDCLSIPDQGRYCSNASEALKFYVNGKREANPGEYVFNDGDQLLISYGRKDEDVSAQFSSITHQSGEHHSGEKESHENS